MDDMLSLKALNDPNLPSPELEAFFEGVSPGSKLSYVG